MNHNLPAADLRVLVVDDHDISRDSTAAALRHHGVEVRMASCPSAGLETALDWLPEAIVTDFRLGSQSGLSLVSSIRQHWPADVLRPRIVLISAGLPESGSEYHGVDEFLPKPFRVADLLAAVNGAATLKTVREKEPDPRLLEVFHQELLTRSEDLDRAIAAYRLDEAGAILHQLIASSAMCDARELEARCRTLELACRSRAEPSVLAPAYVALARAISTLLGTSA